MKTKEERKRKMLLVLPVLILPFLALGFYALGGGKSNGQEQSKQVVMGINTSLPGAQLKNQQEQDKMSLYEKAKRDSAAAKSSENGNAFAALGWDTTGLNKSKSPVSPAKDNEAKINQKLAEINRQVNQPVPVNRYPNNYTANSPAPPELDRLEKLLKQKSQGNKEDPEMRQLNDMLDKIAAIQNPGLAQEKARTTKPDKKDTAFKAIRAVIKGHRKVIQGGLVELLLLDTVTLKNIRIPKGKSLFGSCNITNQRLMLDVKNIRLGNNIIPVDLTVFSLDGMPGINAPEAEFGEAAGNGTYNALQSMEFLPMDQSLTTQAAGAGIAAAKGLIGKKVKQIKVKLRGDTVLLRNNQLKTY